MLGGLKPYPCKQENHFDRKKRVALGFRIAVSYRPFRKYPGEIMSFQIHALSPAQFEPLFALPDSELTKVRAARIIVEEKPGYPCRVSLADAEIGETVIVVNFQHQSAESPYKATHAIFVRQNVEQVFPDIDVVPESLKTRLISVRAFDDKHYMINADVVDGSRLGELIQTMLQNTKVAYLHLHNAKPGCFAARVTRA